MKKTIITLTLLLICCLVFAQTKKEDFNELEVRVNLLEQMIDSIKQDEVSMYNLKRNIIETKQKNFEILKKSENNIFTAFTDFMKIWGVLFAIIGSWLGYKVINKHYKERIEKEINTKLISEVSKLFNVTEENVKRLLSSETENENLRRTSKILLINEKNTDINESLDVILIKGNRKSKFNTKTDEYVNFNNIVIHSDTNLVVIDNSKSDNKKWRLLEKEGETFKLTETGKEMLTFVNTALSNNIGVMYFSENSRFPNSFNEFYSLNNKHLLAYGNAHSNIYNNVMNLLKLQKIYSTT